MVAAKLSGRGGEPDTVGVEEEEGRGCLGDNED